MTVFSDLTLSQKLERAEARANSDFVETRARLFPDSDAEWIEVAGVYAMFDGTESPCTQTFGLGLFDPITEGEMETLEEFFHRHGAPVFHEVSPLADLNTVELLNQRGYHPIELTSVMYSSLDGEIVPVPEIDSGIKTRIIDIAEVDLWAATSAAGWATEHESLADFMLGFGRISAQCKGAYPFLAEFEGTPIATGILFIHKDVALLGGASTVPQGRRKGAQNALLDARRRFAVKNGCTL